MAKREGSLCDSLPISLVSIHPSKRLNDDPAILPWRCSQDMKSLCLFATVLSLAVLVLVVASSCTQAQSEFVLGYSVCTLPFV